MGFDIKADHTIPARKTRPSDNNLKKKDKLPYSVFYHLSGLQSKNQINKKGLVLGSGQRTKKPVIAVVMDADGTVSKGFESGQ